MLTICIRKNGVMAQYQTYHSSNNIAQDDAKYFAMTQRYENWAIAKKPYIISPHGKVEICSLVVA